MVCCRLVFFLIYNLCACDEKLKVFKILQKRVCLNFLYIKYDSFGEYIKIESYKELLKLKKKKEKKNILHLILKKYVLFA